MIKLISKIQVKIFALKKHSFKGLLSIQILQLPFKTEAIWKRRNKFIHEKVTIKIHKELIIHELKKTQMANKYLKEKQLTIASSNSTKQNKTVIIQFNKKFRKGDGGRIKYGNSRDNVSNIPFHVIVLSTDNILNTF
ncbi:hypothetical protein ACTFIV_001865 [Dictyostelium citrinum]